MCTAEPFLNSIGNKPTDGISTKYLDIFSFPVMAGSRFRKLMYWIEIGTVHQTAALKRVVFAKHKCKLPRLIY